MRFSLLMVYVVVALLTDLASAGLYAAFDLAEVDLIRWLRDGLAVALFLIGFVSAPLPVLLRLMGFAYLAWIGLYAVVGIDGRVAPGLILGSAGKLAVPVLMLFAGAGAVLQLRQLLLLMATLAAFGVASTLFGAWEINHTEFWTERLEYGTYLADLKNIIAGLRSDNDLPHNFFGYEGVRRAAGLVAAPLAQGSILAAAAVLGFALLRGRSLVGAGALLLFLAWGTYQSGTRGALLILLIALPLQQVLLMGRGRGGVGGSLLLLALLGAGALESLTVIYSYSVNFDDGSTIGHVDALERNVRDLSAVLLVGDGLGESGALAADAGLEITGGGEGALFSIIYQIGGPGGAVFLIIYLFALLELLRGRRLPGLLGELAAGLCALLAGAASSLILSEHVLTVSGMAPVWLAVGAALRLIHVQRHAPGPVLLPSGAPA